MNAALVALGRASVFLAVLAVIGGLAAAAVFRGRPAARHALLLVTLVMGSLAPLWLAGASVTKPADAHQLAAPALRRWLSLGERTPVVTAATIGRTKRNSFNPSNLVFDIWVAGVAVGFLRLAHGGRRLGQLRARAQRTGEAVSQDRIGACGVPVVALPEIAGAVVLGFVRPVILVAPALLRELSPHSLQQIVRHEAAHVRRRDPWWGLAQRLCAVVYWFHPAVALLNRAIDGAREEACDDAALADVAADTDDAAFATARGYAETLLALARGAASPLPASLAIRGAGGALEARIRRVLGPRPRVTRHAGWKLGFSVLCLVGLATPLAFAVAPASGVLRFHEIAGPRVLSSFSVVPADAAARETAIIHDLAVVPAGLSAQDLEATFITRDLASGETHVLNQDLARTRVTPASTFKVVIALLALEARVASDAHFRLPWDGKIREIDDWNQSHDLASAMATSATWYFEALLARLDHARVGQAVVNLAYGNQDTSGDPLHFWINDTLRISPLEAVDFSARLATDRVPIAKTTRAALDEATTLAVRDGITLYGKTGTAIADGDAGPAVIWLVGHTRGPSDGVAGGVAFATLLRAPASAVSVLMRRRLVLTEALLANRGAFPPWH